MHFASSRPDVVRSINQRWLLAYWGRLRGGGEFPIWQDLETAKLADIAPSLSFHDVVGSDGDARFLIRFHGQRVAEAYGGVCLGKFLDEILPPRYREVAISTYRQVLVARLPVYTIADIRDRNGRTVHYERLLLPFSRDGATVDRILASLETVSPDGAFDNRDILKSNPKAPTFALCTTIPH